MMLPWQKRPLALNSPRDLPGLALWLDSKDVSSLRNDAGAQPVTTDGIKLASDKSGNSSTNVLCLNGVAGNYASSPSGALNQPGDNFEIIWYGQLASWTAPAATQVLMAKRSAAGAATTTFSFFIAATTGFFALVISNGTSTATPASNAAASFSDFQAGYIKATYERNTGGGNYAFKVYSSPDGVTYTQIGATQTGASIGATRAGTEVLEIGSQLTGTSLPLTGNCYYASLAKSVGGVPTTIFAPATASKLAPSFVASTGETWTINTSGATGARISGARDLVQMTAANQPILTIAAAGNYLTFDGSNDYLKAAAFALAQPETVYFVGSQVTWTSTDRLYDGNTGASMTLRQVVGTPQLGITAGSSLNGASLTLATNGVVTSVFNGASSAVRVNRTAAITGDAGVLGNGGGFTLGSANDGTLNANITAQEVVVYSGAHDKATQERVIAMLARNNRIALT